MYDWGFKFRDKVGLGIRFIQNGKIRFGWYVILLKNTEIRHG